MWKLLETFFLGPADNKVDGASDEEEEEEDGEERTDDGADVFSVHRKWCNLLVGARSPDGRIEFFDELAKNIALNSASMIILTMIAQNVV